MKRIISIIILLTILLAITSNAFDLPMPIDGKITGNNLHDVTIVITNSRTGISMSDKVNSPSEYLIDWANSDNQNGNLNRISPRDIFNIDVFETKEEAEKFLKLRILK
jgi:hypothetical protein